MIAALRAWWEGEDAAARGALVLIVLAAAVARAASLGQPMRYDESVTFLYFIGRPWGTAISSYQFPNNHLLYTVAAKLTSLLGGGAAWALRLPAFVAGVAIVPLTYAVGRALFTRASGLIGAALAAGSTPLILYSANARGYAFVVAAYLGLLLIAARIRDAGATRRRWIAFALVGGAGLATIPVMLYPLGAVALWLALALVVERGTAAGPTLAGLAAALAGAGLVALVAYAPILGANGLAALTANKFVAASSWPHFYRELLPGIAGALASWGQPFPLPVAVLLALAAAAGAAGSMRITREGVSVLLAAYVWSAALLIATHRAPFPRTWLWLVPVAALLVGVAGDRVLRLPWLSRAASHVPAISAAAALAAVAWGIETHAVARSLDTGVFQGAHDVAQALATRAQRGDRVLAWIPSNAPLQYYMLRAGADTSLLSTPDSATTREIIVLNENYGQSVPWAVAVGMVDTARFGPIAPAMHARDGDVYVAELKAGHP